MRLTRGAYSSTSRSWVRAAAAALAYILAPPPEMLLILWPCGRVIALHQAFQEELQVPPGRRWQRPGVDLARYGADSQGDLAAGEQIEGRPLLLRRLAHRLVIGHRTDVLQGHIQETVGDLQQLVEDVVPFLRAVDHVRQHPEARHPMVPAEQLDQGVGVGDGGGLVADHHYHLLGGAHETDHGVADAGGGIDQQYVQLVTDVAEGLDQPGMLPRPQVDHLSCARGRRYDADASWAVDHDFAQRTGAGEHIGQGRLGSQTQLHIDIGQSEVCIHQYNAASQLGQCQGKVDRHVGLANAALASGDCNYLNRLIAHLYAALIQSLTCALCVKYTGKNIRHGLILGNLITDQTDRPAHQLMTDAAGQIIGNALAISHIGYRQSLLDGQTEGFTQTAGLVHLSQNATGQRTAAVIVPCRLEHPVLTGCGQHQQRADPVTQRDRKSVV